MPFLSKKTFSVPAYYFSHDFPSFMHHALIFMFLSYVQYFYFIFCKKREVTTLPRALFEQETSKTEGVPSLLFKRISIVTQNETQITSPIGRDQNRRRLGQRRLSNLSTRD